MKLILSIVFLCLVTFVSFDTAAGQNVSVSGALVGNGSYATLLAAINAINGGAQTGANITILITGNTTETGGSFLSPGAWNSVLIQPSGGAARTVTGNITGGTPMITLDGSDNVTIDGLNTGGNSLTISNTSTSSANLTSTIRLRSDATYNVITRCTILGSSTTDLIGADGGNIIFMSNSSLTGNDFNVVSFCNIGPAGTNLPTRAIHFSGTNTSPSLNNNSDTIKNCNIYDYTSSSISSAGIYIEQGSTNIIIKDNRFYQTAGRTMSSANVTHSAIKITNSGGNDYLVSGNTIGYASSGGTGSYTLDGIASTYFVPIYMLVGSTVSSNIQGNTIAGITMTGSQSGTGSSSPLRCITVDSGLVNIGNVTGNTIGNMSSTGSISFTSTSSSKGALIAISNFGAGSSTISNNDIGGITASNSFAAANIWGIYSNSPAPFTCQNNEIGGTVTNSIQSTSTDDSTIVNGIERTNSGGSSITGNTICNLTAAGGTAASGYLAPMVGIAVSINSGVQSILQNKVYAIANTNTSQANVVTGIYISSGIDSLSYVNRNNIHSLNASSNAAEIRGIDARGGGVYYENNMIRLGIDASGTGISTGCAIYGISAGANGHNFYFNSVYIGGSPTSNNANTYALYNSYVDYRYYYNNIFYNARSNNGSTGKHYAISIAGSGIPYALYSVKNILLANGSGGHIGLYDGVDYNTLNAWRTVTGQDMNSLSADPQFINASGNSSAVDLHIVNGLTPVESHGEEIFITEDFDGQTRSSLTPTDIGADAGNFVYIDLTGPSISYTPLSTNDSLTGRSFTNVNITDTSGVNGTAGTRPRCYFKRITDGNAFNDNTSSTAGWKYAEANGSSSPFDFTINYSLLSGGNGVNSNDTIQYFVVAQDLASTPNVGINSGIFSNTPTSVALTAAVFPIVGGINSYRFNSVIVSGALTGNGGYQNLSSAFNAINSASQTAADIVVSIRGNTNEPNYGAVLVDKGWNTLLVKPEGGANRTITGTIDPGTSLIRLSGATKVTIDGLNSGGNSLTITNTQTSGTNTSTIIFDAGASNNNITRCTVLGSSQTYYSTVGGTIVFNPYLSAVGNVVSYCDIGPSVSALPSTAVFFQGNPINSHSNDTIKNCNIYDYYAYTRPSAGIFVGPYTTNIAIRDNKFYQTALRSSFNPGQTHSAIRIENTSGNNYLISGNTIGYSASNGTGNYSLVGYGGFNFYPIYLSVGNTGTTNVIANNIVNINFTLQQQSQTFNAIDIASGLVSVSNNTIGNMSSTGNITIGGSTGAMDNYGIRCAGTGNKNISNNFFGGITLTKSSDFTSFKFTCIGNLSTDTFTCQNNVIGGNIDNSIRQSYNVEGNMDLTGILSSNGTSIISDNIIKNLNVNSNGSAGGSTMTACGILLTANTANNRIFQNTIHSLSLTGTTNNSNVVNGIKINSSSGSYTVEKNLIHSLTAVTPNNSVNGILSSAGTSTFKNNFVRLGITNSGNGSNSGVAIRGISETGGTNNFYFNSIYIGGNPTSGSQSTYGFQSTVITNTRNYYNNIFYNARSNNGSTGKHYSINVGGTAANPAGLSCNYNILYSNGNGGVLGSFNSVDRTSLDAWKTATGKDTNSVYSNPQFVNPTGDTSSVNLHIGTNPSPAEGRGFNIASITDDYDGEVRSTLSPNDIGADAGNFVSNDIDAPFISYSLLPNDFNTATRNFPGVTITDTNGVNVNSGLKPRCYYKKTTDANTLNDNTSGTAGWKYVEASGAASPFDFNINYSLLNGGSAGNGDTIQYFVVAQDLNFSPNAGVNSGTLASPALSVNLSSVNFPVTGTINSYRIAVINVASALAGNGLYTTLGAAFTSINAGSQTGANILINIYGNTTETGATLNSGSWTSLTISPAGGNARSVTGTINGSAMINLNGADNVRIDGLNSGGNSLTISNASTSSSVGTNAIRLQNDATNNVITNCTVLGSTTASYISGGSVIYYSAPVTTGNNNNLISNCNIGPAGSNLPMSCFNANSSSKDDTIRNCNIYDYFNASSANMGIYLASGTSNFFIKDNKFYQTALRTSTGGQHSAVWIDNTSGNNFNITGNIIGFSSLSGTGVYSYSGSGTAAFIPVYLRVGTTVPSSVQGNTFASISVAGSMGGTVTSLCFINLNSGSADIGSITGNVIGNLTSTNNITYSSTSTSTSNIYGVYIFGGNATINNNSFGSIAGSASAAACNIIAINSSSSGTLNCNNNIIGGTVTNSIQSTSVTGTPYVQGITASIGTTQITGNTIRNLTSAAGNGSTSTTSPGGIICWNTGTHTISGNTIYRLTNTSVSASCYVTGIYTGTTGPNLVSRNLIHSLSSLSSNGNVSGTYSGFGTTTFQNNVIRLGLDTSGNNLSTGCSFNGMQEIGGTNNYYFNSVYLGGNATSSSQNTFAFSSSVASGTRNFKNNIFYNARTNTNATIRNYAIRLGGVTNLSCNYNILYAPNSGGYVGSFNSVDHPNLGAWRIATGKDSNSYSANPEYINPNGSASSFDLHVNNVPTRVEQGGTFISSVTDDFDGDLRANFTPTDIGADAGNFTVQSSPLNGDYTVGLSMFNSIAGTNVYFEKTTKKVMTEVEENPGEGDQSINSQTRTVMKEVEEEVFVPMQNGKQYNGPLCIKRKSNPNIPKDAMLGVYANINSALNDLYSSGASGPVRFLLLDAIYNSESLPLMITGYAGASSSNTFTIKPGTGVVPTISGNNTTAVFDINNGSYFTLDGSNINGGTTKDLTVANTAASSATIRLINDANDNVIKNCILKGVTNSASNGVVFFSTTNKPSGNDSNLILNNDITRGTAFPTFCVYNNGTGTSTATKNARNQIKYNRCFDFSSRGIVDEGNSVAALYEGNEIYSVTSQSGFQVGCRIVGSNIEGFTFRNNYIHDLKTTSLTLIYGLEVNSIQNTFTGDIYNNMISLSETNSNDIRGINENTPSTTTLNIYYNSINVFGSVTGAKNSQCYYRSGGSICNFKNNILVNSKDGGTGKHYAIRTTSPLNTLVSNYNDIYAAGGTGNVFGITDGVERVDLAAWNTATAGDSNSISANPLFVSNTNLHIDSTASSPVSNIGKTIAGFTTDFDYNSRNLTTPDIGADEFGFTLPSVTLDLAVFIEGFYDANSNTMVQDSVHVNIRNNASPYSVIESGKFYTDNTGNGTCAFSNLSNGTNYYIEVIHRNSISTWSKTPQMFTGNSLTYDFSNAASQAFGDNMIQVNASPVKFAIYSGDANQDGTIDVGDVIDIYNDILAGASGYVVTDVNGDDFVDVSDVVIAYNNAINIVTVAAP